MFLLWNKFFGRKSFFCVRKFLIKKFFEKEFWCKNTFWREKFFGEHIFFGNKFLFTEFFWWKTIVGKTNLVRKHVLVKKFFFRQKNIFFCEIFFFGHYKKKKKRRINVLNSLDAYEPRLILPNWSFILISKISNHDFLMQNWQNKLFLENAREEENNFVT